jgi:light-regulated signal transduction histidine kinase (bacteriophytochrome)
MSDSEALASHDCLWHCAERNRQPIHLPGSIQPHGILLAIAPTELEILQVSNNTQNYLGKEPEELLGQPLSILLGAKQVEAIAQILAQGEGSINALKLVIAIEEGNRYFDGIVHRTEEAIILELEPTDTLSESSVLSFYTLARSAIAKMRDCSSLAEFLDLAVQETQSLTGFDRVMVYQFAPDGSGCVVAEAKREDLSPYLGLHYPASDVPQEAKELYSRCLLRIIPDVSAPPVELIRVEQPLDLSFSALRSVDPCFVEYLQNMGVAATLVISLVRDRQLWGLISCHHQTPKRIAWEMRTACEFLGQFIALELSHFVDREESDYIVKLQTLRSQVVESISRTDNLRDALIQPQPCLLGLVGASGAAICLDSDITLVGNTPAIEEIRSIIEWADPQIDDFLFCTSELPRLYREAIAFKEVASGLLLLRISQLRRYYILWFRPEVIQTVNWAGNPNESIKVEADGSMTLCPRNSFELWQETVRLTSLPWKKCELDSALNLRNAIIGIVLSKAEELAKLNQELERSNRELASFAFAASHDLKEPLRGIYNYSTILLEDYASVLDEEGIDCLETVRGLSVRMETLVNALLRLSRLGQEELNLKATDLNELLDRVIEVFHASRLDNQLDIRIPRSLPTIQCDPVLVNEIFSNLLGNAFKYNDKAEPWVEIGYLDADEQPVFYVRDNGIGIQADYLEIVFKLFKRLHAQEKYGGGAGAGLAIARKIVERHGGRIWVESTYGKGSTFYFTLE